MIQKKENKEEIKYYLITCDKKGFVLILNLKDIFKNITINNEFQKNNN